MSGKLFDAITRVLICGAAVVLITALAIPELIELGLDAEEVRETWAPWLAVLIVISLYVILFAWPRRVKKHTLTEAERRKAMEVNLRQTFLSTFVVVVVILVVTGLVKVMTGKEKDLDWLPHALTAAITAMGMVAAIEWPLLVRELGGRRDK